MKEVGVDLSEQKSKSVDVYLGKVLFHRRLLMTTISDYRDLILALQELI